MAANDQTINKVPEANTTSFDEDLQNFLRQEDADRFKLIFQSFVSIGGTHGTSAGLTGTPASLIAFPGGHYTTETGSIIYPDNTANIWVIVHKDLTTDLGGNWTRVAGTHYLFDPVSSSEPPLPVDSAFLMRVVTSGGAIIVADDIRTLTPIATAAVSTFNLHISGERAAEEIILDGVLFPTDVTFLKVDMFAVDPPTGADFTVDLLKDGFEQLNIMTLTDFLVSGVPYAATDILNINYSSLERLGLKIKSIGSTNPGAEMDIILHYRKK